MRPPRIHLGNRRPGDVRLGFHAPLGDRGPDHIVGKRAVLVEETAGQVRFSGGQALVEVLRGVREHRLGALLGGGDHLLLGVNVRQLVGPEQEPENRSRGNRRGREQRGRQHDRESPAAPGRSRWRLGGLNIGDLNIGGLNIGGLEIGGLNIGGLKIGDCSISRRLVEDRLGVLAGTHGTNSTFDIFHWSSSRLTVTLIRHGRGSSRAPLTLVT